MDENPTQPTAPKSSSMKWIVPVVVIGLIVIAAVAYYLMRQDQPTTTNSAVPPQGASQQTTPGAGDGTTPGTQITGSADATTSAYQDGTFAAEGTYVTPGGSRNVDVSVTIEDGVITDATFVGFATDPNSRRFQGEFRDNFKALVVGKNIDELQITKVAGSSLSPKGFMDALEQIKTEAQA